MAEGVELNDGAVTIRPVIRGCCSRHREDTREGFREKREAMGAVKWIGEPDAERQPQHAAGWLKHDVEIRTVLCSTNPTESLNARYRRAVKVRGHFPTEQAGP